MGSQFLTAALPYITSVLDVAIVAYLIYRVLQIIRGTRAAAMMWGLLAIVCLYLVAQWADFVTLSWILGHVLSSLILVIVVIFQDEIRRGLTKVGLQPVFTGTGKPLYDKSIEDITLVCSKLSERRIGALIVIQREVGLEEFLEDAIILDAELNRKLLFGIFVKDSPLHDGAVVIEGGRIRAAGCLLPLTFNPDLDPNLGTRHRAALGLSERSDALIIVVSEETGSISLVRDGRLVRNLDAAMLRDSLHRLLSTKSHLEDEKEDY